MARVNRQVLERLRAEYDTRQILDAVDALDEIRSLVRDDDNVGPPEVRSDLLKLHGMAHNLINEGHSSLPDDEDISVLAFDIEDTIDTIRDNAEKILDSLQPLMTLSADPDDDDEDML